MTDPYDHSRRSKHRCVTLDQKERSIAGRLGHRRTGMMRCRDRIDGVFTDMLCLRPLRKGAGTVARPVSKTLVEPLFLSVGIA